MANRSTKKSVSFRIKDETKEKIIKLAEEQDISQAKIVERAIEFYSKKGFMHQQTTIFEQELTRK